MEKYSNWKVSLLVVAIVPKWHGKNYIIIVVMNKISCNQNDYVLFLLEFHIKIEASKKRTHSKCGTHFLRQLRTRRASQKLWQNRATAEMDRRGCSLRWILRSNFDWKKTLNSFSSGIFTSNSGNWALPDVKSIRQPHFRRKTIFNLILANANSLFSLFIHIFNFLEIEIICFVLICFYFLFCFSFLIRWNLLDLLKFYLFFNSIF